MSSRDQESLSALLDNEADDLELRRVLQALDSDPELARTWTRMSLVQAVLHDDNLQRSDSVRYPDLKLADAVAAAIGEEPVASVQRVEKTGWTQALAKLSIAAAVALAFFVGMQVNTNPQYPGTMPMAQQNSPGQETTGAVPVEVASVDSPNEVMQQTREVDPQARQRLDEYIQSVSITREEPEQWEQIEDSPLYRLVNEIRD